MADVIKEVQNKVDIVDIVSEHVSLSKKGKNFWGLCPFHEDTNPSMSVSPEKQMFKCFVCGTAGGPIKFVSLIKNQPYVLALEELANKVGVDFKSKKNVKTYSEKQLRLFEINKEAMNFFQYSLSIEVGDKALEYVKSRGLSQEIIDNFSIGYAPSSGLKDFLIKKGYDEADLINLSLINSSGNDFFKDRLIFTIKDEDNNIVGFSGRDLSNKAQAKYINSSESEIFKKSTIIYNFSQVKNFLNKDKIIYINEGFMDVIAMSRAGIKNSVAIMGTSLTKEHLKTLSNFKIRLFLDSDKAGINATIKSIKILLENKISVEVVQNNTALDPDEILDKKGVEELIKISNNLISGIEFIFNMHKKQYGNTNIANVKKFVKTFKKYLILLDPIEQSFYIKKACKYLSIDEKSFSIPRNKNISSVTQQLQDNNKLLDTTKIKKPFKIDSIDDKHNWSYVVILSMLKKAEFRKVYKEKEKLLSIDNIITRIADYIANATNKSGRPTKEMIDKMQEIKKVEFPVETIEEFEAAMDSSHDKYLKDLSKELVHKINSKEYSEAEKAIFVNAHTKVQRKLKKYE